MKIKKCPFCGGNPDFDLAVTTPDDNGECKLACMVVCQLCGARGPGVYPKLNSKSEYGIIAMAVRGWNKREMWT